MPFAGDGGSVAFLAKQFTQTAKKGRMESPPGYYFFVAVYSERN
jgi:hypothetical protein